MHTITISGKRGCEFAGEQGGGKWENLEGEKGREKYCN